MSGAIKVNISVDETTAALQIDSTTQGALPAPRMTEAQRDAIVSPADALLIFNTDEGEYQFYDGASWASLSSTVGTVTSVGLSTNASFLTVGSSPVTGAGTITLNKATGLTANQVVATPDGSPGTADLRALVAADIPNLNTSKLTAGQLALARGGTNVDHSATGPGTLIQATNGANITTRLDNLTGTAAPTVNEDSGDGYAIGSRWLDTTNDKEYVALDVSVGAAVWKETTAAGGGGTDSDAIHDNVAGEIAAITTKASPVSGDYLLIEDSADSNSKKKVTVGSLLGNAGSAEHNYYRYKNLLLEPMAIEQLQYGTFTYAIGSTPKLALSVWSARLGAGGRYDVREQRIPRTFRNVTFTGLQSTSTAVFIDSALPSYTNPRETYYDRLLEMTENLDTKYVSVSGGNGTALLLPGPYGIIITGFTFHDTTWLALATMRGWADSALTIHDEIGDGSGDDLRMSHGLLIPASKNIMQGILLGTAGGPDSVLGGITYIICPDDWSAVPDSKMYDFRDDFMSAAIDTSTVWTRSQSSAGNVEIDARFQWLKVIGNGSWGANGMYSQASIARASGKIFECDVFMPTSGIPNLIVGFHDGGGQADSDFSHGIDFTTNIGAGDIYIFENGNNRGRVGSWSSGKTYRVRITLGSGTAAVYEIQGGTEHPPIGGASWANITPGVTNSSTTPLHAGVTMQANVANVFVSDIKIY